MGTFMKVAALRMVALWMFTSALIAQAPSPSRVQPRPANPSANDLLTACRGRDGVACDELGRRYLAGEALRNRVDLTLLY